MSFCGKCGQGVPNADKFCRVCGSSLEPVSLAQPTPQNDNHGKRQQSECPVCNSNDAVQKIGTIIDAGVVNSAGSHGGLVGQFGSTQLGYYGGINLSTSQSELARRLMVPIPQSNFQYGWLLIGVLCSALALYQWFSKSSDSKDSWWISGILSLGFGVIPGLPLGWILGAISKKVEARRLEPFIEQAAQASTYVRGSFYCSRDDVAFGKDFYGNPEVYIQKSIEHFDKT